MVDFGAYICECYISQTEFNMFVEHVNRLTMTEKKEATFWINMPKNLATKL